jgi:hypothetical protein
MTETRAWPRAAFGVAILIAGALLIAWGVMSLRGTRSQVAAPVTAAVAASTSTQPASVDLVQIATSALQSCPEGTAPQVPDGAKASAAAMAAAHTAFQAYDTATNNYTRCVDAAVEHIAAQYKGTASPADIQSLEAFGNKAHDTAIDQEQAVADQFNTQIRTFKARRPHA